MAMFVDVDDSCTTPGEQKVAESGSDDDSDAQPDVVGHEDEHQHVADCYLDHVQQRLDCMSDAHHVTTTTAAASATHSCIHSLTEQALGKPTDTAPPSLSSTFYETFST